PIGIGKEGWKTPVGETRLVKKREDPVWVPPQSIRQEKPDLPRSVPAGPDNPLGSHALNMGWPGYVIHGTNQPYGIGRRSSHGCIRLYPKDIPVLFDLVDPGTPITVVDQAYKIGWYKNTLFLEVIPLQQQSDEILEHGQIRTPAPAENIEGDIAAIAGQNTDIDWRAVKKALQDRSGMPVPVGRRF
ncbi:MAG: L,D-transpeptidase, partial [Pseudomonadota bacterium]